tara:strand:+ start:2652 stop:4634 length:1983 start_codon:yes stop_codon:yes gene_type:complete
MAYIGQKPGSNFRGVTFKDSFTGDGSTVAFDLGQSFNQAGQNDLEVFVDNVRQEPTTSYTVGQDGNGDFKRITFTAAPAASATIYVLNQGESSGVLTVSDNSVTSGKLNADAITGHTELSEAPADTDTFLVHDASASAIKKIANSNLVGSALITGKTALGEGAASNDQILIFDTSAGALKKVTQTNLLNFPTVSSVSPTNVLSGDGTGNHTFVITGSGFTGATANLINDSGNSITFDSQTVDSDTQITGVVAKSSLPNSGEPYDVRVAAASGLASTLTNQINVDAQPVFSTAAGSLGTVQNGARSGLSFLVAAADPESAADVVYTLESGSIPAGLSFSSTSSGALISGDADAVGSNTTSTFTIRAKDAASNTSDRTFTITVNAPVTQSFTSSGTFSVPSGISAVDVLVIAGGGGGGGGHGGGGGAGGLIYRPGFTVTPGGTVSVTVGSGGSGTSGNPNQDGTDGQDSVFGTLTAKGGGHGGGYGPNPVGPGVGGPGGSGGGGGATNPGSPLSGGSATQPTQSGESGNYGFGSSGGGGQAPAPGGSGGGGGGAGAAGSNATTPGGTQQAGAGGIGKAYTIADGTTSVYYAGGGGGGGQANAGAGGQGGGGQGSNEPLGTQWGTGTVGTANRGGGGGGGNGLEPPTGRGGSNGGKGIVIVRY